MQWNLDIPILMLILQLIQLKIKKVVLFTSVKIIEKDLLLPVITLILVIELNIMEGIIGTVPGLEFWIS